MAPLTGGPLWMQAVQELDHGEDDIPCTGFAARDKHGVASLFNRSPRAGRGKPVLTQALWHVHVLWQCPYVTPRFWGPCVSESKAGL